jgi:hypothetical protein
MHMFEYSVSMLFSFGEGGTVLVFRVILWVTYLSTDKTNKQPCFFFKRQLMCYTYTYSRLGGEMR